MKEESMVAALEKAGYKVQPPPPPIPTRKCARCDVTDDDDYLTDITVTVNDGEEGFDWKRLYFCDQHLSSILKWIKDAGWFTHHHGSTDLLEDTDCPAAVFPKGECPTPEDSPYERSYR